jgi:hypothetical protein
MNRLEGGVWACSALIPDNPEARSHLSFNYDTNIDALQYGGRSPKRYYRSPERFLIPSLTVKSFSIPIDLEKWNRSNMPPSLPMLAGTKMGPSCISRHAAVCLALLEGLR